MQRFSFRAPTFLKTLQVHKDKAVQNVGLYANKFEERIKGTMVENWVKYWKNVFSDYKDVAVDIRKDVREKPLKAGVYFGIFGTLVYCAKHNPTEQDFRDVFISCTNQLIMVHPSLQNPNTAKHLLFVEQNYNRKAIRRLSLGVGSIIWVDRNSDELKNYDATCPYLQLKYSEFKDRVLDVGFLNRWWVLNSKMIDYDVNY